MRPHSSGRARFLSVFAAATLVASCAKPGAPAAPAEAPRAPISAAAGGDHNLLKASTFDDGKSAPWTPVFTAPAEGEAAVEGGAYCVKVANKGTNRWDAQFRHREMVIQKGHTYSVSFKGWASSPTKARVKVGMSGPPYAEYWSSVIDVGTGPAQFVGKFTMLQADDATAELAFHVGGDMARAPAPYSVCIDDVRLEDPEFSAASSGAPVEVRRLAVNQVGYLPEGVKRATFKDSSKAPLAWSLKDNAGAVVLDGQSKVFGDDGASGEHVHLVDFSAFRTPGKGYVLAVGETASHPFDIEASLYSKLRSDAFSFFYHNRSGIEIRMPFAGSRALARPAGHTSDRSVRCRPRSGCDYSLDVSGGWYDAGDHGKYVVNGGISVWTLLNLYERTQHLGKGLAKLGDGTLAIPENANGVPDILDEARWELEFLLKMQVPEGQALAGMAHHKIHDDQWTALGVAPHEDKERRSLHAPSTAATLNLAAAGAACARIWKAIDAEFAGKCLSAAERAYAAARKNPALLVTAMMDQGGGTYPDGNVEDEFYWAAAELFITTGKAEYRQGFEGSKLHARFPTQGGGHSCSMNWADTAALGMLSLAVVPSKLAPGVRQQLRNGIVAAADKYLRAQAKEGYETPLERTQDNKYLWGSNSFVLNNQIVLALAHDFTKQRKYADGVVLGMDYLLGRNPLDQSYVTGYGERALQNPHHRFWAHQANGKYPKAPPGVVSGGPNSNIEDPYSVGAGLKGCVAQKCFVDHIEAWSVNEVTINWNAPLAWVLSWLDEQARN